MRARPFSRFFFSALLLLAGLASASGGCSRQTEGERCDLTNGDTDDCDAGLVCTACDSLRTLDVPRCCPPAGSEYSDPRCAPTNPGGMCVIAPTEGGGGEAGTTSGEAASSSGAASSTGGLGGSAGSTGGAAGDTAASSGGAAGDDTAGGAAGDDTAGGAAGDTAGGSGGVPSASGAGGESGADSASGTGGA